MRTKWITDASGWRRIVLLAWCTVVIAPLGTAGPFDAEVIQFTVPSQPIDTALIAYAAQAHVQLIVSNNLLKGLRPSGVTGRYSREAALEVLLQGTGLQFEASGSSTITIVKKVSTNN